jgi:hypothetical protein
LKRCKDLELSRVPIRNGARRAYCEDKAQRANSKEGSKKAMAKKLKKAKKLDSTKTLSSRFES